MQTWILQRCRQKAVRQMIIWAVIGTAALAVAALNTRYTRDFVGGPYDASESDLLRISNIEQAPHVFLRVRGTKLLNTGIQQISIRKRSGVEVGREVSAGYFALVVGKHLLLVKTTSSSPATQLEGAIRPIEKDVHSELFRDPKAREAMAFFYPFQLETEGFRYPGYWAIGIALVLGVLFIKYGLKAWARMRDPSLHPAAKRVAEWGDPISLSAEIEQESKNLVRHRLGSTVVTDKYILTDAWLTFQVLRLQDLLWAYKRVTKHYTYFIPTGKSFEAVLICYGGSAQFSGKENLVDEALQHAAQKAPWAAFGYSKELETTFNKKTAEFCAAIEERKRQASATAG